MYWQIMMLHQTGEVDGLLYIKKKKKVLKKYITNQMWMKGQTTDGTNSLA